MCRVLEVNRSGFYRWLKQPVSVREKANTHLLGLIRKSWLESGCVYGSPRIYEDLRELGERCGVNRVARLMKANGIAAILGYKRRYKKTGLSNLIAPNYLQQQFIAHAPDQCWVPDITYIRTYEGFLYVAIVVDLYSRQIIGWSMQSGMHSILVENALLMAVWRRQPQQEVIVHSDQGVQYTSDSCQRFMKANRLVSSMSRRGNCYDNAVAESVFSSLKKERIKRRIYATREVAKQDIFEYMEVFYNRKRRHSFNDQLSPVEFEKRMIAQR